MQALMGAALVGLLALGGCGDSAASQYLGKWVSVKDERRTLEIVENGDAYLVKATNPRSRDETHTSNFPATFSDGMMKITNGFGGINLAVDETTGKLTDGSQEFERQK